MTDTDRDRLRAVQDRWLTPDGLPRDARDWTPQMWAALWRAMQAARREIAAIAAREGR